VERIYQKIGRIRENLALLRAMKNKCLERFTTDPIYRGAVLHYLYLLSDSCIALAELVVKQKKLRIPQSYHEAFDILGENNILEPKFAFDFAKIAGFRNFLAHDYEQVDAKLICEEIMSQLDDVNSFIKQIEDSLQLSENGLKL
jgi:uncharacterized protein YutE (UPF0331/DUF86 family)